MIPNSGALLYFTLPLSSTSRIQEQMSQYCVNFGITRKWHDRIAFKLSFLMPWLGFLLCGKAPEVPYFILWVFLLYALLATISTILLAHILSTRTTVYKFCLELKLFTTIIMRSPKIKEISLFIWPRSNSLCTETLRLSCIYDQRHNWSPINNRVFTECSPKLRSFPPFLVSFTFNSRFFQAYYRIIKIRSERDFCWSQWVSQNHAFGHSWLSLLNHNVTQAVDTLISKQRNEDF